LRDRGGEPFPQRGFLLELFLPGLCKGVVLRAAVLLGHAPLRLDPPLIFEALQRRVERPLLDQQDVARQLTDTARDRPAVQRFEGQRLEDQQVERALDEVDGFRMSLPMMIYTSCCR
jgi:hypothetical protein